MAKHTGFERLRYMERIGTEHASHGLSLERALEHGRCDRDRQRIARAYREQVARG